MNKKARGCLIVFGGFFLALVAAGFWTGHTGKRADDNARALCEKIPVGSTLDAAHAVAKQHPTPPREIEYEGKHRFAFHGGVFHQAECNVEARDGIVVKTTFQVDDY